jgi:predicted LPLAT superfamily acyltransferase
MLIGMRLLLLVYRIFGRRAFSICLFPVMCYYYLLRKEARQASTQYLHRIRPLLPPGQRESLTPLRHFLMFGEILLDKLLVWMGHITRDDVVFEKPDMIKRLDQSRKGGIIVVSHLGNFEICNALANEIPGMRLTVLVYTRHAGKFNTLLKRVAGDVDIEILQVTDISPATVMMFAQRISEGGYIVIAGDRTPVSGQGRVSEVEFLGDPAPFPQGPFILAGLLKCPVYLMFCLKQQAQYHIYVESFGEDLKFHDRKAREQNLQTAIQKYAARLEYYCTRAPLQWFNFSSFWSRESAPKANHCSSTEGDIGIS